MKISVGKTKVMHVGKTKQEIVCTLNDEILEQVEFTIFSEDSELVRQFEERRRSHVFNKN